MNVRIIGVALVGVVALFGCSSKESPSSNGEPSSGEQNGADEKAVDGGKAEETPAKKVGDDCSCTNDEDVSFGEPIGSCYGRLAGCFSADLACVLLKDAPAGETGNGICMQKCTNVDQGKQGPCGEGETCAPERRSGLLLCQ